MQEENLTASKGIQEVNKLLENLEKAKSDDAYDKIWKEVSDDREAINKKISEDNECQSYGIVNCISSPSRAASRVAMRDVNEVALDEEEAAKIYWKEFYVAAFEGVEEDLKRRLENDMLKTLVEMEVILVQLISAPEKEFEIENIVKNYGTGSGKEGAPFGEELTKAAILREMEIVREEWRKLRSDSEEWKKRRPECQDPLCADDVIDMMKDSFKSSKTLSDWKGDAPIIMKMLAIMATIAATSAFAERTFSLARRLKSYLRSQKLNDTFYRLGIIAWYDEEEINFILDFVRIVNDFINSNHRKGIYGLNFSEKDFIPKQFDKTK